MPRFARPHRFVTPPATARMAADAYSPCPYCVGTDKKKKFCCADIDQEMAKVARLKARDKPKQALAALEKLAEKKPATPWNQATRASLLVNTGRAAEALPILETVLAEEPENKSVLALHAAASLAAKGFAASRQPLWRAFRKSAPYYPDLVSGVAAAAAGQLYRDRRYPAAREHLVCALKFAAQDRKQDLFMRLMEFDGDAEVPYPLRSVHPLSSVDDGDDEAKLAAAKARRIAESGCYGAAADKYAQLAKTLPKNAAVRANVGFCRAFDGDHSAASGALKKAAALETDFETAAELEAVAQLLALTADAETVDLKERVYAVDSVSRLLTDLDANDLFHRLPDDPRDDGPAPPDAVYELLDRPIPDSHVGLTRAGVPNVVGELTIFDAVKTDETGPRAVLSAFTGEEWDAAEKAVDAAGLAAAPDEEQVDREGGEFGLPRELWGLRWRWAFPDGMPLRERRALEGDEWKRRIETVWPETELAALDGKTPLAVSKLGEPSVPLAGALYVLDAVCDRGRYELDLNDLREQFSLPTITPQPAAEDANLAAYSILHLQRTNVASLTDRQLLTVMNRALLVHPARFLRAVLTEALGREGIAGDFDRQRAYHTLGELARDRYDYDEAFDWLDRGRAEAKEADDPFEAVFRWDTRELALRLETPDDPELAPLIERLDGYYGPKLPQFRPYLRQILKAHDVDPPASIGAPADDGEPVAAGGDGGLWTPDAPAGGSGKKLILPGVS